MPETKLSEEKQTELIKNLWKDEIKSDELVEIHVVKPYVENYPGAPSLHVLVERNPLEKHDRQAAVLLEVRTHDSDEVHWKARFVANPASLTSLKAEAKNINDISKVLHFGNEITDKEATTLSTGDLLAVQEKERSLLFTGWLLVDSWVKFLFQKVIILPQVGISFSTDRIYLMLDFPAGLSKRRTQAIRMGWGTWCRILRTVYLKQNNFQNIAIGPGHSIFPCFPESIAKGSSDPSGRSHRRNCKLHSSLGTEIADC